MTMSFRAGRPVSSTSMPTLAAAAAAVITVVIAVVIASPLAPVPATTHASALQAPSGTKGNATSRAKGGAKDKVSADVERDTRVERERTDPSAVARTLEGLGYEQTAQGFLHAVNDGRLEAVTLFLQLGMSPDSAVDHHPVLMSAATLCNPDPTGARVAIVKALLAAGAAVDPTDENGSTPLLWAVSAGCPVAVARALIAAGANVNVTVKGGATPLMLAKALRRPRLVKLLKKAGAKE